MEFRIGSRVAGSYIYCIRVIIGIVSVTAEFMEGKTSD
jgi:hypothetical protein